MAPASLAGGSWIQPVAAYQPSGRAYAIDDQFAGQAPIGAATNPQPVPGSIGPVYLGQPNYYQQPVNQGFAQPTLTQPGLVQPGFGQPLSDPYTIYTAPAMAPILTLQGARRQPYAELEGVIGDQPETLRGNLFFPFLQRDNSFWFADIRGHFDDEEAAEGNFGVAYRRLVGDIIVGAYGFYDLRHTQFNNNFQGATVGVEALDLNWEGRFNWYIPEGGSQATPSLNQASLVNNAIVVRQGLERALYGFDGEIGRALWRGGGLYDAEVRGFVGGYYFNANAAGFNSYGGPRARLEGRLYDLPRLGPGSRVTLDGTVQYDDVRDVQWLASLTLRVPFGAGGAVSGTKLSPIERRMLSPIMRDEDIVTRTGLGSAEQAVMVGNGRDGAVLTNLTEVNSTTANVPAAVAAGGPIVVVASDVATNATTVLNPGQFIGGRFQVRGQTSGAAAAFGSQTTVNATGANAIQVADNSAVVGLNVTGNMSGIVGGADNTRLPADADALADGVTSVVISNNAVTAAMGNAIALDGPVSGSITGNTVTGGAGIGIGIGALTSGTVSGNTATGSQVGINVASLSGGSVTGNTANGNQLGMLFEAVGGGVVSGNTANNNTGAADGDDSAGFAFGAITGGTISGNTARGNASDGFTFGGNVSAGTITANTATGNNTAGRGFGGFNFFNSEDEAVNPMPSVTVSGTAVVSGNTSNQNAFDGFAFGNVTGGTITGNMANANNSNLGVIRGNGGYSFFNVSGGSVTSNTSTNDQAFDGFFFATVNGAGVNINNNTSTGNFFDGFNFGTTFAAGNLQGNAATNNASNGGVGFNTAGALMNGVFTPTTNAMNPNTADDGTAP